MPERTCVACRTKRDKGQLVRIVVSAEGVEVDSTKTAPGRGAYVCDNDICLRTATQKGTLARALRRKKITEIKGIAP
jgi:predicted RNA-binding protein YlxR (DUF448 family)